MRRTRRTRRTRRMREARKRDRQIGPREEPAAAMVTVGRIPASPRCYGDGGTLSLSSPLLSSPLLSLFILSFSLLHSHADRHSHTRESPSSLLSSANLLSDDKGRLTLSRSLRPSFVEDTAALWREGSRKRGTDGGDSPRTHTHA